jgi:hypothetical protein
VRVVYWLVPLALAALMLAVVLRPRHEPKRRGSEAARPWSSGVTTPVAIERPPEPPFGPLKHASSELPCDVDQVLADKCRRCHGTPQRHGAPFSLFTWAEMQPDRFGEPIYKRLGRSIETGFMPFNIPANPPIEMLTPEEKKTLLDWVAKGAPRGSCVQPAPSSSSAIRSKPAKETAPKASVAQRSLSSSPAPTVSAH